WFINHGGTSIGRITTGGTITDFPIPQTPVMVAESLAAAADGSLWFTTRTSGAFSIGRMSPGGAVTTFTDPALLYPAAITAGPDGALWFVNSSSIGRITTAGVVTAFGGNGPLIQPTSLATGPDGGLWFTNRQIGAIGRITTSGARST